ncbi:hypothetical protein GCM10027569_46280 [Flindersiella endophytica]
MDRSGPAHSDFDDRRLVGGTGDGSYLRSRRPPAGRAEDRYRAHPMFLVFGAVGCILGFWFVLVGCTT